MKIRKGVRIITSKEMSKQLGISVSTLHYYESVGLILPTRSENNYRNYSAEDRKRIKLILFMKKMNLSLEEMKMSLSHCYCNRDAEVEDVALEDKVDFYLNKKTKFEKRVQEYITSIITMDKIVALIREKESKNKKEKMMREIEEIVDQFWKEGKQ